MSNLGGGGAHLIHHNGSRGITVGSGSNATLSGQSATQRLEIYQNGFQGAFFASATGSLGSFVKIYQNNQNPPSPSSPSPVGATLCEVCALTSSVGLTETEVSAGPGHGFFVALQAQGFVRSVVITANTGDGVRIEKASGVQFNPPGTGTPTNIGGNTGDSVKCADDFSWISGDTTGIARPIKCTILR